MSVYAVLNYVNLAHYTSYLWAVGSRETSTTNATMAQEHHVIRYNLYGIIIISGLQRQWGDGDWHYPAIFAELKYIIIILILYLCACFSVSKESQRNQRFISQVGPDRFK